MDEIQQATDTLRYENIARIYRAKATTPENRYIKGAAVDTWLSNFSSVPNPDK